MRYLISSPLLLLLFLFRACSASFGDYSVQGSPYFLNPFNHRNEPLDQSLHDSLNYRLQHHLHNAFSRPHSTVRTIETPLFERDLIIEFRHSNSAPRFVHLGQGSRSPSFAFAMPIRHESLPQSVFIHRPMAESSAAAEAAGSAAREIAPQNVYAIMSVSPKDPSLGPGAHLPNIWLHHYVHVENTPVPEANMESSIWRKEEAVSEEIPFKIMDAGEFLKELQHISH